MARYVIPYIGKVQLAALTPMQVQKLCNKLYQGYKNQDPLSPKTIQNIHGILHTALKQAVLCGIISRNGEEIVPAKWTLIEFTSDGLTAMGYDYDDSENRTIRHVYDLATGEVLYEEARNEHVSVEGNRINVYSHHKKGYYRPPFHTDIYDSRMNLIFSADARLVDFGGYYHAQYGDGSLGVLDMDGNVIGVTTIKFSGSSSSGALIEGLGFAIPINTALKVAYDLVEYGYVRGRAFLGITVTPLDSKTASYYGVPAGSRVEQINEGSCAEKSGIIFCL
jgi:hypothetical protein